MRRIACGATVFLLLGAAQARGDDLVLVRAGPGWGWPAPSPYPFGRPCPPYLRVYPPPYFPRVYVLPPVWMPPESVFGPPAIEDFMRPEWQPGPNFNIIVPRRAPEPEEEKENAPSLRGTGPESVALAWRFIGYGDAHFENQKYADANQRYRKATEVAPRLADSFFRQGYALVALGRYDAAAKVFKRGLAVDPEWPKSKFRNDGLYGANQMAKKAHLDVLAAAALKQPDSADLLFLVGLFLHFDGQQQRAKPFLQKAVQLAAGDDAHLRAFP